MSEPVLLPLDDVEVTIALQVAPREQRLHESRNAPLVAAVEVSNAIAFINTETNKKEFLVKVKGENPEHAVFSPDAQR